MAKKKTPKKKARKTTTKSGTYWNYRIVADETGWHAIHEVFYRSEDDTPFSMTENPVDVSSETKVGVVRVLRMMLRDATRKPVLKRKDLDF